MFARTNNYKEYKTAVAELSNGINQIAVTDVVTHSWKQQLQKYWVELAKIFGHMDDHTQSIWSTASLGYSAWQKKPKNGAKQAALC